MNSNLPSGPNQMRRLFPVLLAVGSSILSGCGNTHAAPAIPMTAVMNTIRDYGRGSKLASAPTSESAGIAKQTPQLYDLEETYKAHIKSILVQEDFSALETEVRNARNTQARAQGGVWKLYFF